MTSPNNNPNRSWADMVAASRKEAPAPVDVRHAVRTELESLVNCGKETPNKSWTEMVAASRQESPAPVDVRYAVRAQLESLLRSGNTTEEVELDWSGALLRLFSPGFVKLGVAAAFVCMLVLAGTTSVPESDVQPQFADPLVSLTAVEANAEWSDWL